MTFAISGYESLPSLLDLREVSYLGATLNTEFESRESAWDEGRGLTKMIYKPSCAEEYYYRVRYFLNSYLRTDLLETYWFCTRYYNKSFLSAHTDRNACEVSVSINILQDQPWELQLLDRFGKKHKFETQPGDAVLYRGIDLEHWRTPYQGQQYTQLFFHYVTATGPYHREQGDEEDANPRV